MSPVVKKALIAVGAKKAFDVINEKREAKKERSSALGKLLLVAGGIGVLAYAINSGKLQPIIEKVRGNKSSARASSNGSSAGRDVTLGERPLSSPVA